MRDPIRIVTAVLLAIALIGNILGVYYNNRTHAALERRGLSKPCIDGMTLNPGETCYFLFTVPSEGPPVRTPARKDSTL
jgi:hypothetical protein